MQLKESSCNPSDDQSSGHVLSDWTPQLVWSNFEPVSFEFRIIDYTF